MLDPFLTKAENISGEFSRDRWERLKKIFKGETIGKILEQDADWDTRTFEDRRATKNFRIGGDE